MQDSQNDSFEEILPENEKEDEDYEIITGLRDKIVKINSLSIDKSRNWLTCGTSKGFRVYVQKDLRILIKREGNSFHFECGVQLIHSLFMSYIFALVPDGLNKRFSDTKIYLYDDKQRVVLRELECFNFITKFEFLKDYLLVQTQGKFPRITIYPIETLEPTKAFLIPLEPRPHKHFTINSNEMAPVIAYLQDISTVVVYNLLSTLEYSIESKYDEIQCITLSQKADLLAIADKDGCYIAIHKLPNKELVMELYRGRSPCKIKQMAFCRNGSLFIVHSNRETLHFYDIERKEVNYTLIPVGIVNMIQNKYLSSFAKYYINPQKAVRNKDKEAFLGDKGCFQEALISELEDGNFCIVKDNGDMERMGFDNAKGGWGVKLKEKEWFDPWDLIEDNIKGLMKVFGGTIVKHLGLNEKKQDQ